MKRIKNGKFDIVVGIPTYNEADNIANVVQKIDKGLVKFFPDYKAIIINLDSDSADRTSRKFLSVPTKTAKLSFINKRRPRGKGANIFSLLRLSRRFGAKYTMTIDADVKTVTEKWPVLLLSSLIEKEADFVAPVYTRDRYDGNVTNHFCFPLLYAWFGKHLNQPIGGDFAMNDKFREYVLNSPKPKNAYLYGIDIFLSGHAIGGGFNVKEVYLGRKIHKPSFDKLVPMFRQVAITMLLVLSQYKHKRNLLEPKFTAKNAKQRIDSLIIKPEKTKTDFFRAYASGGLEKLSLKEVKEYLGLKAKEMEKAKQPGSLIFENEWIEILSYVINYVTKHRINEKAALKITTALYPFFFLRVLGYFKELNKKKTKKSIEALIQKQAERLREIVLS